MARFAGLISRRRLKRRVRHYIGRPIVRKLYIKWMLLQDLLGVVTIVVPTRPLCEKLYVYKVRLEFGTGGLSSLKGFDSPVLPVKQCVESRTTV